MSALAAKACSSRSGSTETTRSGRGQWTYRVTVDGPLSVLQSLHTDGWFDLYAFTLEGQYPIDYVVANHFTSTYHHSPFVHDLLVQRTGPDVRLILHNREFTEQYPARNETKTLPDDEALLTMLDNVFGLRFPAGTRFFRADRITQVAIRFWYSFSVIRSAVLSSRSRKTIPRR